MFSRSIVVLLVALMIFSAHAKYREQEDASYVSSSKHYSSQSGAAGKHQKNFMFGATQGEKEMQPQNRQKRQDVDSEEGPLLTEPIAQTTPETPPPHQKVKSSQDVVDNFPKHETAPYADASSHSDSSVQTKVTMDNHASSRYHCIGDIQEKTVKVFADWLDHKGKIGYADPAANHNIEDQISWASSKKLFERYGKSPLFSCGASDIKNFMPSCSELKDRIISELGGGKGVLYFNPFGSWGSANRKMHLNRLHLLSVATEAGIPFVSGPQLMHYDANAVGHIQEDDDLVRKYGAKEDLLTFRSKYSYEFALKHYGNHTTVREAPDISFMLGPLMPTQKTKYDVFVLMRVQEQNISDRICKGVRIQGYHCAYGDWGYGTNIERMVGEYPPNYAEIGVQMGVGTISLGEVIVTDRLQAVILGFLAGKNVLYVDTTSKKIGNVLSTAFEGTDCINVQKPEFGLTELITTSVLKIVETAVEIIKTHGKGR
jgi:exopolysaccharide biosynthesis predicted pyruvyltransferase EpsI